MNAVSLSILLSLLFLVAFPPDAFAQRLEPSSKQAPVETRRTLRFSGNVTTTNISGKSGSRTAVLQGEQHEYLYGFVFSERGDDPCYVRAFLQTRRHGVGEGGLAESGPATDMCSPSYNDDEKLSFYASRSLWSAVHAVRVGMNRKENKIKAVTIYGSTIDQDMSGEVRRDESGMVEDFERPNFREPWKNKVSCDPGQVAVGAVIHYDGFGNDARITGIALRCDTPTVGVGNYRPGTLEPVTLRRGG